MSPAQEEALNKVKEILSKHFDAHCVIALSEHYPGDMVDNEKIDSTQDHVTFDYQGGIYKCLGMIEDMRYKILRRGSVEDQE